jgi:hypothetical protein
MDLRETWIEVAKCLGQRLIRTVMDIDQAKVIILPIRGRTPSKGMVVVLEPVEPD